MTGKAVRDTHSNPLVEDIDDYVESPDDLLLSINFSETSNECLQLSVENVDAERFESLQVMDPDIKELRSLAVENVAMEDNVGDMADIICTFQESNIQHGTYRRLGHGCSFLIISHNLTFSPNKACLKSFTCSKGDREK